MHRLHGVSSRIYARFAGTKPDTAQLSTGKTITHVPQVQSASGAKYEGRGVTFWNKGRDAMVTWHGANINCANNQGTRLGAVALGAVMLLASAPGAAQVTRAASSGAPPGDA